jgi:hypothetical protein
MKCLAFLAAVLFSLFLVPGHTQAQDPPSIQGLWITFKGDVCPPEYTDDNKKGTTTITFTITADGLLTGRAIFMAQRLDLPQRVIWFGVGDANRFPDYRVQGELRQDNGQLWSLYTREYRKNCTPDHDQVKWVFRDAKYTRADLYRLDNKGNLPPNAKPYERVYRLAGVITMPSVFAGAAKNNQQKKEKNKK